MKFKTAAVYISISAGFTLAVGLLVWLAVTNLGYVALSITGSEQISGILSGLKTASVRVPIWMPAVYSATVCLSAVLNRRYNIVKKRLMYVIIPLLVLLAAGVIALTLWYTKVNGVPFHTAAKILASILTSGVLDSI